MPAKKGILLLNLGTPTAPTTKALKPYLRTFLMDPYVLDIPYWKRWLLVNLIIVPFRSPKSAKAFQKVWTKEGSPLLVFSKSLQRKLQQHLGGDFIIELGMRYGNPSTTSAIKNMLDQNVSEIVALPLYPHYAESSTRTGIEALQRSCQKLNCNIPVKYLDQFYDNPHYLKAKRQLIKNELQNFSADHLLFSYHGLPVRHIINVDSKCNNCVMDLNCGERKQHPRCYRGQCFQSTDLLTEGIDIPSSTSFQSRLGRDPWIKPYTDHVLIDLAKQGVKKLAVACPAFTADCLETLEEIAMQGKEDFIAAGGEDLKLIPALNDTDSWVSALSRMATSSESMKLLS